MCKKTYLLLLLAIVSLILCRASEGFAFILTVTEAGSGNGVVTSNPTGINCPSDCTEDYKQGKKVTLKAKPDNNSSFAGWAGAGCTGISPCSVIMNDDETVVATFNLKTPEISLSTDSLEFDLGSRKRVSKTLVISNVGTGSLIVTASVEGADFSITGNSTFTIKPNRSYNLKVTYAPSNPGALEAEPTPGPGESGVEASSESGDIKPSAQGQDDQPKLKLHTNDPQNEDIVVELVPLVQNSPLSAVLFIESSLRLSAGGCDNLWTVNESNSGSFLKFVYEPGSGKYISQPLKIHTNASGSGSCGSCTETAQENNIEWTVSGEVSNDKKTINLSAQVTATPSGTYTVTCQGNPPQTVNWVLYTVSGSPPYKTSMDFKDGASKVVVDVVGYTLTFLLINVSE